MSSYILSSLNYGIEINPNNSSIDFKNAGAGPELFATLRVGLYSLSSLRKEIQRAITAADPTNTYTVTVDRTVSGGAQNRVTIDTDGAFLSLLFSTGTRSGSSIAAVIGFSGDQAGSTSYTGSSSAGTILLPTYPPQDFQPLGSIYDARRTVNDTTSGLIETVSFTGFRNFQYRFKWIRENSDEYMRFQNLIIWMLRGGAVEHVADISDPSTLAVGIPLNMRTPVELNRMTGFYDYFETPTFTFRELV